MPRPSTAARRYAEAAFELAHRDEDVDGWANELRLVAAVGADPATARLLDNPAVALDDRERLVHEALEGRVRPAVERLAELLVRRGRASMLPAVSAEFDRLLRRERGIVTAVVTSAVPLEDDEIEAVRRKIAEIARGATAEVETRVDESLIGGVTIQIGDRLIDGSVRGRLQRLRAQIVAGRLGRDAAATH